MELGKYLSEAPQCTKVFGYLEHSAVNGKVKELVLDSHGIRSFVPKESMPAAMRTAMSLADGLTQVRLLWSFHLNVKLGRLDPIGLCLIWKKGGFAIKARDEVVVE